MPSFDLKIRKVKSYNMQLKKHGFATRAIINGIESFSTVAEEASRNTTLNKYELEAALGIAAEQFARALKNGFAIDLGPIGKIYPTIISKWTEKAEDQRKSDLKPSVRYDVSLEIKEAVAGCKLTWDNIKDEEIVEDEVIEDEVTETTPPSGGNNQGGDTLTPDPNAPGTNPDPNPTPGEGNGENNDDYTPPDNDGGFGK